MGNISKHRRGKTHEYYMRMLNLDENCCCYATGFQGIKWNEIIEDIVAGDCRGACMNKKGGKNWRNTYHFVEISAYSVLKIKFFKREDLFFLRIVCLAHIRYDVLGVSKKCLQNVIFNLRCSSDWNDFKFSSILI